MSIPSWARKGVKVVYLGPPSDRKTWPEDVGFTVSRRPDVGAVYTIRQVLVGPHSIDHEIGVNIKLVEYRCSGKWPDGTPYSDAAFAIESFRPLQKTMAEDVALIKSHLKAPRSSTTKRERSDA